ncbi:uncharacterized protein EAE97_003028 [Botrytis byssoidea]|uniref:Inner kinetochore subunit AME1 domain-containing protein n=1 Tax=Botrytis byssoidea TaxID=139641 RepID=A0A9P5M1R2_9HELO|nr:uncharacterized protein EAE97_003028 [Botrytis byssoidea]KAF7949519.1 hypothetical protein EAE97_003028 [Botrytis byssoidea]
MESTREERMQQRLRGGAQRQVKDVDFGFMLPAFAAPPPAAEPSPVPTPAPTIAHSLPEAPANPETPQPELPSQPISQTPATATRSRERSSNILGLQSNNVIRSNTGNDANTSAKRRKLETDEPPSSSTRSMRSSRSSARKDVYDLPEDEELEQPVTDHSNLSILETSKDNVLESGMAETVLSPTHLPSEPIESIERDPSNEIGLEEVEVEIEVEEDSLVGANTSLEEEAALAAVKATKSHRKPPRPSRNKRKRDEPSFEPLAVDESILTAANTLDTTNDDIEEVLPQKPRRSRRKSALQEDAGAKQEEMIENNTEQAEAIDDYEAAVTLKKSRGRRISRSIVASDESIPEDAAPPRSPIAKKKRGRVRQVTSPVQQRQPAPPKSKPQRAEKKNKKQKVREGSPIPVIVHRLTKGPVYDEDDSDAEILNSEIPCATRAGVNAVDVLGQICQELVTAGLETLGDNAVKTQDAAQRLEYKTKMRAVDSFGKELRVRLLEHTINLDNSYSLEKRLREGQKKKLSLREEILRVRAEREKVALRMDGIRIAHEKNSHDAQQREVLNTTVHDIELAVERGKSSSDNTDDGKTNIELMLKRIASEASSASDDGGVLKQIKAFNAFMERAALAFEGKKAV